MCASFSSATSLSYNSLTNVCHCMFIVQYINNKVLSAVLIYVANKTFIVIKYRKCGRRVYNT